MNLRAPSLIGESWSGGATGKAHADARGTCMAVRPKLATRPARAERGEIRRSRFDSSGAYHFKGITGTETSVKRANSAGVCGRSIARGSRGQRCGKVRSLCARQFRPGDNRGSHSEVRLLGGSPLCSLTINQ